MDIETAKNMSANKKGGKAVECASYLLFLPAAYVATQGQLDFAAIFACFGYLGYLLSQTIQALDVLQKAVEEAEQV